MIDGDAVDRLLAAGAAAAHPATFLVGSDGDDLGVLSLRTPPEYDEKTIDLEPYMPQRRRHKGTVVVRNAASFIAYVNAGKTDATEVFADGDKVTAVFNHDGGLGWSDHKCIYELKFTPAWTGWTGNAGKLMTQEAFGEWLEENALDVLEPSSGALLETVLNLRGKNEVTFDSSKVLSNGSVQLLYREDVTAQGGRAGTMDVPTTFKLALQVFEGGPRYEIPALLRWRLSGGHVQWMWKFASDVKAIFEASFEEELKTITAETGLVVLRGRLA